MADLTHMTHLTHMAEVTFPTAVAVASTAPTASASAGAAGGGMGNSTEDLLDLGDLAGLGDVGDPLLQWSLATGVSALVALSVLVVGFWLIDVTVGRRSPVVHRLRMRCRWPARLTVLLAVLLAAMGGAPFGDDLRSVLRRALLLLLIGGIGWLLIRSVMVGEELLIGRLAIDHADNLRHRSLRTQVVVTRRVANALIVFLAVTTMLLTFDEVRTLGQSLLASAGLIGVVAGVAAQTTLGNVFAGIQIAFTEPIRIEDVVVVEGEWGNVEELTLTYVVVRIWDRRRLVLPTSYFVTNPFQNWTRTRSQVIGTVYLYVDWSVPVDALRAELDRQLADHPGWDGDVVVLQVVEVTELAVQVRALMTSPDAPTSWDLRCDIREALVTFVQREYPDALPRLRTAPTDGPAPTDDPAPPDDPAPTDRPGSGERPDAHGQSGTTTVEGRGPGPTGGTIAG